MVSYKYIILVKKIKFFFVVMRCHKLFFHLSNLQQMQEVEEVEQN